MSAQPNTFRPSADSPHLKSRTEIKKSAASMFENSFDDLDHMTIYRDPLGSKTPGPRGENTVELQKQRREQLKNEPVAELDGMSIAEKWNSLQRDGWSVEETTREIRKNLDTGDWTLPRDILAEVFVINPERLPMADMMTRVATQDDEVVATARSEEPGISWGLETTDDTEGSYSYSDATYDGDPVYPVVGLGAATRLEDKLILASSNLRNAESTTQQAFLRAMEQEIERQIILGTDNNANGWDGFNDFVTDGSYLGDQVGGDGAIGDPANANPEDFEQATREIIDEAEYEGAPKENLAVVCDFDWHKEVRDSLVSQQRYEGNIEELNAGFSTLTLDNVPVFKSHAIPRIFDRADGSTYNQAYTVNLDATYLAMLQETSMKPLAKVAPQEQMAFDAYGTLVSEDFGAHVQAATVSPVA
jgi:hypothetical protein